MSTWVISEKGRPVATTTSDPVAAMAQMTGHEIHKVLVFRDVRDFSRWRGEK